MINEIAPDIGLSFPQLISGTERSNPNMADQAKDVSIGCGLVSLLQADQNRYVAPMDVSRFRAAPSARLGHFPFECDGAFPAQC